MKKIININCPCCNSFLTVEHFSSYNFQEEGNSLSAILNDSWIMHKCKQCNNYVTVHDIMVFHDMEKKILIFYFPNTNCTYYEQKKIIKQYKYPKDYTIRIVNGLYNDFKEKILIFEYGLNDKAIEFYKAQIILEKINSSNLREAHLIFDEDSLPLGFAFYLNNDNPIYIPFDNEKYEMYVLETKNDKHNELVHYSLIIK